MFTNYPSYTAVMSFSTDKTLNKPHHFLHLLLTLYPMITNKNLSKSPSHNTACCHDNHACNRNSFSDGMSLDSHDSGASGGGQRTGTYEVAVVNQNFQHDETAMSTASDYDLGGGGGGGGGGGDVSHGKDKKRKKKGLRDVIFKRYVCKVVCMQSSMYAK